MNEFILYALLIGYIIYSFAYCLEFYRANNHYSKKQKTVHLFLIWIIPFLWIFLLKSLSKETPGSQYYSEKRKENPLNVNDGESPFHESGKGF